LSALVATWRGAVSEALANRVALGSQMAVMIANDVVWVAFWVLFFREVGAVRGYDDDRVLMLLAVITSAAGLSLGLLANARRIGSMAVDGELDAVLALPVTPLAYLLLRRIEPIHLGDLAFGIGLFAVAGDPTPLRALVFVSVVTCSAVLITGFLVLTGSIAFFAGRAEGGELGFQAIILLGSYPSDIFAGVAKILLLSVVPAVFVSAVPARLVARPDLSDAAALVAVTLLFAVGASVAFARGLRRYTSGSMWTRA